MSILLQNDAFNEECNFSIYENEMWKKLFTKQVKNIQDKAYPEFLHNLNLLDLKANRIPNIKEINSKLFAATGWQVVPVKGLLDHELYFELLSNRKFPIAMMMRTNDEENLSKDPDIFHEVFGHCTMLISREYADFMYEFATFSKSVKVSDRPIFARLIWFTTETGLIHTENGLKIFGSSILSSYDESIYCLTSPIPTHKPFNLIDIYREPYRADILQTTYYLLENTNQLYSVLDNINELYNALQIARLLGEHPPKFTVTNDKYINIGHCNPLTTTLS